jgi:hypothetical protein
MIPPPKNGEFHRSKGRDTVERKLATTAFWIGILSTALAIVMRGLAIVGIPAYSAAYAENGHPLTFRTFLEGAILFFVMAIAAGVLAWSKERKA